jgi:hypothetical protein
VSRGERREEYTLFKRHKKTFGLVAAIVVAAATFGAQAFTASNTVPATLAGNGAGAITGYAVSNVAYTTTDDKITAVDFDLDADAADVKVQLLSTGGTWYDCGATTGVSHHATCVTNEDAAAADQLSVTATQ